MSKIPDIDKEDAVAAEERNAWILLVVTVVAVATYVVTVVRMADGGPLVDVAYQPVMLWTIAGAIVVAIVATIVGGIVGGIVSGEGRPASDQRDREIGRFGSHVGQSLVVVGGTAALVMALAEWDWFWIANVLYLCFALSGVLEAVARIVAYRRGLPQW